MDHTYNHNMYTLYGINRMQPQDDALPVCSQYVSEVVTSNYYWPAAESLYA